MTAQQRAGATRTRTARPARAAAGAAKSATSPWTFIAGRAREYALLMRMDKPIGALLLLWPTLWALWLSAHGSPRPEMVLIFVAGVWVMRSAGCVINDFADRGFDPHVQRTRDRPLAARRAKPQEALVLFAALGLVALGLVLLLNTLALVLALVGAALTVIYPFLKRYTYFPQIHLGVAFGWGIPMAWAAQTDSLPPVCWLLLCGSVLWTLVYDTMYAMSDREDDLRVGVKSTAILFGDADRAIIAGTQVAVILVLALVGRQLHLGLAYYAGLALASIFSVYQQRLIRERERLRCFHAFLNNNWFGAAVFAGIVIDFLLRS